MGAAVTRGMAAVATTELLTELHAGGEALLSFFGVAEADAVLECGKVLPEAVVVLEPWATPGIAAVTVGDIEAVLDGFGLMSGGGE